MASHLTPFVATKAMNSPVMLSKEFTKVTVTVGTGGTIYIGCLVQATTGDAKTVDITGAESTTAFAVVLNTANNRRQLSADNSGATLTKELFFSSGSSIECGLIHGKIFTLLMEINGGLGGAGVGVLEIGDILVSNATGGCTLHPNDLTATLVAGGATDNASITIAGYRIPLVMFRSLSYFATDAATQIVVVESI